MSGLARIKRMLITTVSVALTAGMLGGAGAAVYLGQDLLASRAEARPEPAPAPLTAVSVQRLYSEPGYQQTRSFVGQIEALRTVAASFELSGRLDQILVDEGDTVEAGQLLATQDTDLLVAERDALRSSREAFAAQLAFALQRLDRAAALEESGFATQSRIDEIIASRDEVAARIQEVDANLAAIDIRIEKATLRAPFAGRVTQRFLDGGEALSPGQAVLEVIETGQPLLRVGLPLSLEESELRAAVVSAQGTSYRAELVTLRPDIDPTTRTRTALFRLQNAPALAFGQTAELRIETEIAMRGTWVPLDALKEGARGEWTLLVLDDQDVVQRASALVIHAESDRVFVQGSFAEGTRVIEAGTRRVVPGQTVAPTLLTAAGS